MKKMVTSFIVAFSMLVCMLSYTSPQVYASGVDNITARADYLYNITWTAQKTVKGWKNNYTYTQGTTYRIPYGQPVTQGKFICYGASVDTFTSAAANASSVFYSTRSYYSGYSSESVYYAMDCSTFVSYCWGLSSRSTTSSWSSLDVTSYGKCTSANVSKIKQGDALNLSGSHIVLISRISNGKYEVTEQTPPQITRNWYTATQLVSKFSSYTIYRYNKRDSVPPAPTPPTQPTTPPTQPPVVQHDPMGVLDSVEVSDNMIIIKGWAFDYDNTAASVEIHAYIDDGLGGQIGIGATTANKGRPDVNDTYKGVGECHGFEAAFGSPSKGTFNVYVYALNTIGEGSTQLIGKKQVTVSGSTTNIYGNFDDVVVDGTKITVVGWAFDKADTSKGTGIHVYIDDGNGGQQYIGGGGASESRQDVDNNFHAGSNHGFSFSVAAPRTGTYNVYVYAISVDGKSSKLIGSKQVTISPVSTMSINKTVCRKNDKITFTFYSNNSPTVYTIGIDKNGTRVITQNVTSPFSISTLDEGSYTAYVTAFNPTTGGCDSNKVSFTVADMAFTPKKRVVYNGHTYTLYDGNLSWKEAKNVCSELGGNLVTITSEQEQNVINNLLTDAEATYYWIGLSDAETEGNYQWVTGENYLYSNWCDGQPDNWNNEEDYIVLLRDGGGWNDTREHPFGFILEKETTTYTISYNANGGSGAPAAQTKKHDEALTISSTKPIRSSYTFLGWAETANATTAQYQPSESFTGNKNVTLYAVWKATTVSSVVIKNKPTKTTYNVGDTFDASGMKLKATYDNGDTKEITSGYTYTPSKLNTAGQQKIVVSYGGKSTGFYVTVNPLTVKQIRVTKKPTKTSYIVGDTLNTSGMQVTVTYSDDTTKVITSGFKYTPSKLDKVGTQWITVTYGGTATAFPVSVKAVSVDKIRVTQKPTKTTYVPGNSLNISGMQVTVTYTDGTTKVITEGFTCTPTKFTTVGLQWITVKYGGTATAFPVNVVKQAQTIRVIQKPTKTTYIVGNSLNTSGLKLRATYADGTTQDVTSGFTCTPTKLTAAGNQWITVVYGGQSTAFVVKVESRAKTVRVTRQPTKKTYLVGEALNTSGMQVTATYDDGTTNVVTDGFVCSPVIMTKAGTQWVTVIYGGQSTAFPVTVT